jgi:glycosyltransferase involved in cell wall biosynthesis
MMNLRSDLDARARQSASVVTPVLNNGRRIIPTLESVRWADEVIVVDMFSTDDTEQVCGSYPNVRFFQRQDYIYGNVNFGFAQATSDWVIRLDSDEVLNPELQQSILTFLQSPPRDVVGCIFPSVQYMFGRPMRFGPGFGGPPRRCMFRRGAARYRVQSEHEDFEVTQAGRWIALAGHYEHFTNATVREIVTQYVYYAEKDVERAAGVWPKPTNPGLVFWRGLRLFWLFYWKMKGYREGCFGFYTSLMRGAVQYWIAQAEEWHRVDLSRRDAGVKGTRRE